MYKSLSIVLLLILLINPVVVSQNSEFSSKINNLLSDLFIDLKINEINSYIAQLEGDKLYLDIGSNYNLSKGQKLLVVRPLNLLKDPITRRDLAVINKKLAVVTIKAVKKDYSVAEITKKLADDQIDVGDKVINNKSKIKILLNKFKTSQASLELAEELEGRFYSYLTRKKLFDVNSVEIKESKKLGGVKQKADYFLTGEIYNSSDKIFIKVELYNINSGLVTKERVISFDNKNQIINYYQQKYKDSHSGYKLLFKTKEFEGPVYNFKWGDFKEGSLLFNTGSALKIMSYNDELITNYTIDKYQRSKYDDYNLVVANINNDQQQEIFVETYNYPVQFKKKDKAYQSRVLEEFNRNRPKQIVEIDNKHYLISRDYKHYLRFNLWQEDEFETDFKIKIAKEEGYRLDLIDIDSDQNQELIVTSYQGEQGYKIKIYNLDYKLKSILGPTVGAEFVTANLNNNQQPEIYTYSLKSNKLLAFEWQKDQYQKIWESEKLSNDIVDLTVGDINNDGKKELLVLVKNDNKNRIYTYYYKNID